jgi:hypothetical protein
MDLTTVSEKKKPKTKPLDISGYKRRDGLTSAQGVANFLAWGRQMFPFQWWPWNMIHKAITGRAALARPDSAEVLLLRRTATRARQLLRRDHDCDLRTMRQIGARATVGSEDTAGESGPAAVKRMQSAQRNLIEVNDMVDPAEIKDPKLREFVTRQFQPLARAVNAPAFKTLLALPAIKGDLMPPERKKKA